MPRWLEVTLAAGVLLVLLPVLAIVAVAIGCTSRGPVLYRQTRVGRGGHPFTLLKFRTMTVGADRGGQLTLGDADPRTTRVGRVLRRAKLDELPQLANVIAGTMSLVGPRPEVPRYVDLSRPHQAEVLRHRPGLTDPASLAFRNEVQLLDQAEDPERFYLDVLLPAKLELSAAYLPQRTWRADLGMLVRTVGVLAGLAPAPTPPGTVAGARADDAGAA